MAGWGNGAQLFPVGDHVAQIRDWESTTGKDFKDPTKMIEQFKWGIDFWDGAKWISRTIYTGQNFADPSKFDNPQFIPKLCKLVHACGHKLPTNADEAAAWKPDALVGEQFIISVTKNDMNGALVTEWKRRPQAAPSAAVQATAPAPAAPPAPAPSTPPAAPPPAPAGELVGAGAGVAGPSDAWA